MSDTRQDLKDTLMATLLMAEISDGNAVLAVLEVAADFAYSTGVLERHEGGTFSDAARCAFVATMAIKALEETSRG